MDRRCARILVKMDLRNGLYEEIKIVMHGNTWWQRLDYWKIPFICFNCREVGHMQRDCHKGATKPLYKKIWRKKDKPVIREKETHGFK